jgi:hypothetical protein
MDLFSPQCSVYGTSFPWICDMEKTQLFLFFLGGCVISANAAIPYSNLLQFHKDLPPLFFHLSLVLIIKKITWIGCDKALQN